LPRPEEHDPIPFLSGPLSKLEALGCTRPEGWSLTSFLEALVSLGLLEPEPAREYLAVYQEARFSGRAVADERMRAAAAGLEKAIEHSAKGVRSGWAAMAQDLRRRESRPEPRPPLEAARPAKDLRSSRPFEPPMPDIRGKRGGRLALALFGLLLWSLILAWAGYSAGLWLGRRSKAGAPTESVRLVAVREQVSARPQDLGLWWRLANLASDLKAYREAINAFHRILAREPENAEALNNLAWLHLTAEDPLIRDPVLALPLAEKAFERLPEPFIEDTLAEALYQNDYNDQAVALAEDALARTRLHREYYQAQLAKFREAVLNAWNPFPVCEAPRP